MPEAAAARTPWCLARNIEEIAPPAGGAYLRSAVMLFACNRPVIGGGRPRDGCGHTIAIRTQPRRASFLFDLWRSCGISLGLRIDLPRGSSGL
jgi:hypothetical protein